MHAQLPCSITLHTCIGAHHIDDLRVKCDNLENGCRWVEKLSSLSVHLKTCDYALLPCDNDCTDNGQTVTFLRKNLSDHLTNHCPRRKYQCRHCNEMGEHHERTSTHLDTCPQLTVLCPNKSRYTHKGIINLGCKTLIPRCQVPAHISTCEHGFVPCKYAEAGCEEKLRRKHRKEHEENYQFHLKVTTDKVLELTQQLRTVEQLTFRLDGFQTRRNDKTVYKSSFLYTLHKGYKFQIQVYAGGNGSGEGTHISIYACLMKGDYDDALTWPFLGVATFELLNQIEDKNHHKETIQFNANCMDDSKVECKVAHALQFIKHRDLEHKLDKNCQYCMDDALIFRVSVRPQNYKPWLQCTHE